MIFEQPSEHDIRERRAVRELAETLGGDGYEQRPHWLVGVESAVDAAAAHNLHFFC
jgi:hypothetical protein